MSEETIVAMFDTAAHADDAVRELQAANVPAGAISRQPSATGAGATAAAEPVREQGFWSSLFGGESDDDTVYDRSVGGGSHVVSVRVPEDRASAVTAILERNHPIDIDERAASYGPAETTMSTRQPLAGAMPATATSPATGTGDTIQLAEERLSVGKRVVNRGGTRIRRYVVETPVEENVTLHTEKVVVDRRPVTDGRPVTNADFSENTIEMTETSEEAIVGKEARVVEEVSLRKKAVERTETVRDTVRKEEVEIEQIPGTATTTGTGTQSPVPRTPKI